MKKIDSRVLEAINKFVSEKQSFISLDIYCLLGIRIEDSVYPIHQQVRDAFTNGLMPNYLSEWVQLKLEGGGYANVWRYYLPNIKANTFLIKKRSDGRFELSKEMLGHFPLFDSDFGIFIENKKIIIKPADGSEKVLISDLEKRLRLNASWLSEANLATEEALSVQVNPTTIVVSLNQVI